MHKIVPLAHSSVFHGARDHILLNQILFNHRHHHLFLKLNPGEILHQIILVDSLEIGITHTLKSKISKSKDNLTFATITTAGQRVKSIDLIRHPRAQAVIIKTISAKEDEL